MDNLVLNPTATAQWYQLVNEAENTYLSRHSQCHRLSEEMQSYLVFLLMRYVERADLANAIMALEYLHSFEAQGKYQIEQLQVVGDKCLIYAGLFPEQAIRRRVNMGYYAQLGRSAYASVAHLVHDVRTCLFTELARQFVMLMDILQVMRELGNVAKPLLQPLQAIELWQETGSSHALEILQQQTTATPVLLTSNNRH